MAPVMRRRYGWFAMGAPEMWTETLVLSWRAALRFYEHGGTAVLRALNDSDRLTAFLVEGERVGARLSPTTELIVTPFSMSLSEAAGEVDRELALTCLRLVLAELEPPSIQSFRALCQHLTVVDDEQDAVAAQARAADALLSHEPDPVLRRTDSAVLLDAVTEDGTIKMLAEYGVVSAAELADRLSRRRGRISQREGNWDELVETRELPAVAVFVDSRWTRAADLAAGAEVWTAVDQFLTVIEQRAGNFSASLHAQVLGYASREDSRTSEPSATGTIG